MTPELAIEVRDLVKTYAQRAGFARGTRRVQALRGVSLDVPARTTLGVVGESGCGKTTLARCVVGLERPTAGTVRVAGLDVGALPRGGRRLLARRAQYVFQDPWSSLDPRMTIGDQLAEPLAIHRLAPRRARREQAAALLARVGLPADALDRYPHEFSGGQRQRVGIARALAVDPAVLVADEPVSALDVSVQAQVINLLLDLQQELGLTLLFIAHDLKVVEFVSDRVAVMYLGQVVELATRKELFRAPRHPYSQALLAAAPSSDPARRPAREDRARRPATGGEPPSPLAPPPGCPFHPRCPRATEECRRERPPLAAAAGSEDHEVACWHPG
jgi:oligopeptide/dipeptide ABC transporter ATP-binding protein